MAHHRQSWARNEFLKQESKYQKQTFEKIHLIHNSLA